MTPNSPALSSTPRSMAGVSLVELMIAMLLGLIILAGLATIFANSSRSREELERSSRQIENGRYAMETLTDDLRMAGFYGELNVKPLSAPPLLPPALPDPCSTDPVVWNSAIPIHVQGYDNGVGIPPCVPASRKADTDVIVIRRSAMCEAGVAGCPPTQNSLPFVQASKCLAVPPEATHVIGSWGTAPFTLHLRDCATVAGVRQYYVRIYYISTNNGQAVPTAIPTLTRLDFTGTGWTVTPLVEGIEEMNIEWGIDWHGLTVPDPVDGAPDVYTTDPTNFTDPACPLCANPAYNWSNVMTARINILARNIDATPNYVDGKTYTMGRDASGAEILVTPGGPYRRHAYTGMVRIVNPAQRRDVP